MPPSAGRGFSFSKADAKVNHADERIAFHEAGHAILGLSFGFLLKAVTIDASGVSAGKSSWHENELTTDVDFENAITVAFGGMAAEQLRFGGYIPLGCSGDVNAIAWLSRKHSVYDGAAGGCTSDLLTKRLKSRALELLSVPTTWSKVETLAAILLVRRTITVNEAIGAIGAETA